MPVERAINIMGIRGIPAAHGGFETFAARLAPYLQSHGWKVLVYCQHEPDAHDVPANGFEDDWEGIHRVHLRSKRAGPVGTMEFDLATVRNVIKRPGIDLVLGYNTALFNLLQRMRRRRVVMNMDGIEWKRDKWSFPAKAWFFINELAGMHGCSQPIADHPEIAAHLRSRGCRNAVVIPYGSDEIREADPSLIEPFGLQSDRYFVSIARIEPENSILEIVRAFVASDRTDFKLAVLGKLQDDNAYHRAVRDAAAEAGEAVLFPGAIYDASIVSSLRFYTRAYLHGHQVGGTNPSLVEALGAGNAVIAHDNRFNRWTAGAGQFFFRDERDCRTNMDRLMRTPQEAIAARAAARRRHDEDFRWEKVLDQYRLVFEEIVSQR
jgi:glycosyltransferase involved in cell wall biosynthesis